MAARTLGHAQTIARLTTTNADAGALSASTDTALVPTSFTVATARAESLVYLIAGTVYPIRWGGADNGTGTVWGAGVTANTATWRCDVMAETTQTSSASDSVAIAGTAGGTVDRTFNYTPAVTGTYRLKAALVVTVTATGSAVANANTDEGNFGSAAPVYLTGFSNKSFTPGLVTVGTTLSTPTRTPSLALYPYRNPVITVTQTFPFAVGSGTSASAACTVSYRDTDGAGDVEFATTSAAATTSASKTDTGLAIDDGLPAGQRTLTDIGLHFSFGNSALSTTPSGVGLPWSFVSGTLPTGWTAVTSHTIGATEIKAGDLFQIDPRVTGTHHFQIDNNTFTLASDDNTNQMLSTQSGFLWTIVKNALAEGLDGLTVSQTLTPVNPGTAVTGSGDTSTQNGQIGVSARLDWTSSKPGGTWNKVADITAPTTIDDNALFLSSTDTLVMLNADPRIRVLCGGGDLSNTGKHFSPGQALTVGLSALRSKTRITFDTGTASAGVFRLNGALGRAEYWDGAAWLFGDSPTFHALTLSAGDSKLATKTFAGADTTTWTNANLFFIGYCEIGGTPYLGTGLLEVVSASNAHDGNALDAVDFALNGNISFK